MSRYLSGLHVSEGFSEGVVRRRNTLDDSS